MPLPTKSLSTRLAPGLIVLALVAVSCGNSDDTSTTESAEDVASTTAKIPSDDSSAAVVDDEPADETDASTESDEAPAEPSAEASTFVAEVWADNWFALYANGVLVGEDSVPITTERSFNAETITFDAAYPLTLAIEAKDFKETDSGIEYIGEGNQQMGDGGLIAQITDTATGEVITVTSADWSVLVIHRAPLNTDCEKDADPDATCEFEITDAPADWAASEFDDGAWTAATVWGEADVSPKDGYDEISWDAAAQLVWGTDLEVDNTILLRLTVS